MEIKNAVAALAALAQESRLATFRLLIQAGDDGLPAGRIAEAIGIPHNTLSSHLGTLSNSGLLRSRREGRRIIYTVDFDAARRLLGFLLEDCCQGSPELCDPALDSVLTNYGP
jgi:ArsR family transcriptional regulator